MHDQSNQEDGRLVAVVVLMLVSMVVGAGAMYLILLPWLN